MGPYNSRRINPPASAISADKRRRSHRADNRRLLETLEARVLFSTSTIDASSDPSGRPLPTGGTDSGASVFLSSSAQSSIYGAPVTLVARVLPSGLQNPNGTLVDFLDIASGTPVLLGTQTVTDNAATLLWNSGCLGDHQIIAQIESGQALTTASSAPLALSVSRAATETEISTTGGVIVAHIISDATVSGGTVSFFNGTHAIATVTVGPDGIANCPMSVLRAGKHTIVAAYNGAANYVPSTSPAVAVKIKPTEHFRGNGHGWFGHHSRF